MTGSTMFGSGLSHHGALLVGYLLALVTWDRVSRRQTNLWPSDYPHKFARPWVELGFFGIAMLGMIGVGQLYARHLLLPSKGPAGQLFEALNQLMIFAPVLALPLIRRQGWNSAWLPMGRVWQRVLIGVILSLIATLAFTSVRTGSAPWIDVIRDTYHPKNFGNFVQVLCEDAAIAILFVRIRAAIGLTGSIILVAVLFAALHIPAMLTSGVHLNDLLNLAMDAGLGIVVLYFLQRGGDVWWFWLVHFSMDMMQFYAVRGMTH